LAPGTWERFLWPLAAASAVACAFAFHPVVVQNSREPTWLAEFLWNRHPAWNNPLPEIFAETLMQREERAVPIATSGCDKVLFMARGDDVGLPIPCYPATPAGACAVAGTLCYANRAGARYEFVRAPGSSIQLKGFVYQKTRVWPHASLNHVRRLLEQAQWWTLRPKVDGQDILRQIVAVHAIELDGTRRVVFILRDADADAEIVLRPPARMTGVLTDAMTGVPVREMTYDGPPLERWEVPVPRGELFLLSLWE
jgi:hypothetical protein